MIDVVTNDAGMISELFDVAFSGRSASQWERIILIMGDELPNGNHDAVEVTMTVKDGRVMFSYGHGVIEEGVFVFKSRIPHGAMNTIIALLTEARSMVGVIIRDRDAQRPRNGRDGNQGNDRGAPRRTRRDRGGRDSRGDRRERD